MQVEIAFMQNTCWKWDPGTAMKSLFSPEQCSIASERNSFISVPGFQTWLCCYLKETSVFLHSIRVTSFFHNHAPQPLPTVYWCIHPASCVRVCKGTSIQPSTYVRFWKACSSVRIGRIQIAQKCKQARGYVYLSHAKKKVHPFSILSLHSPGNMRKIKILNPGEYNLSWTWYTVL